MKLFRPLSTRLVISRIGFIAVWSILIWASEQRENDGLKSSGLPTLLIWGLQDEITPPETALHFHDLLPYSELKFIDVVVMYL